MASNENLDPFLASIQSQVMTQLRPMVVAFGRNKAFLDAKDLDRIETEARRLVHNASHGACYLQGIERDEPASRGLIVCNVLRAKFAEPGA